MSWSPPGWSRGSPLLRLELPHVLHQPLHALDRHGVVDTRAHAADGAVAFELHHAARFGAFQKLAVEFRIRQGERDVHARAVALAHGILEEGARVEEVVEQFRLFDVFLFDRLEPALLFQPLEHEARDVPGVARGRVRHGVGLGLHFVVEDGGRALHGAAEEVFPDDDDDEARGAGVLLRPGVDQAELRDVERSRQEVRRGVGDQRHFPRLRDPVELHPADGLVRDVVHVRRLRVEPPGRLLGREGEVLPLGARRDVHLAEAVRLLDRELRPLPRIDIVGGLLSAEEVHGNGREVQPRAALEKEHLVVRGHLQQFAEVFLRLRRDPDELLAAVAHLHHRHARPVPVEHFGSGLREHLLGQDRGAGGKIEDAGHYDCPFSSSSSLSATRSTPASLVPSSRSMRRTPCVERPISRICATLVRISTPPVEISMISSSSPTSTAPTTLPLRAVVWIAIIPCVPRPWRVYSAIAVRLPKPFSVAVSTVWASLSATSIRSTFWSLPSFMPRTPCACRPIGRTSSSSKRTALPASEKSITSCLPSVIAAPMRWSPSSSSTAMIPFSRGLENCESGVFFTVPSEVARNTKCLSSYSLTGSTALIFSPSESGKRFTMGLPRLARVPCGTLYTFSQ